LPPQALALMKPESDHARRLLFLLGENAPTRTIMGAGAGFVRGDQDMENRRGST